MGELPFAVRDRGAYFPDADALVIADVHLGRARVSNVEFPLNEAATVADRLEALVEHFEPAEVVIAGDALHSFSHVPDGVADAFAALGRRVEDHGSEFVVVEGNHDPMLESLVDVELDAEYRLADGTVVCHGHESPATNADRYVIGHDHPAMDVEGERRPCFLWGEGVYQGSDVLALPAFNELAAGVEVNGLSGRDVQSPLLSDLRSFRPIVYDPAAEEALTFPPLSDMRQFL